MTTKTDSNVTASAIAPDNDCPVVELPLPGPFFQYAVKFVCGKPGARIVAPGTYFTAINVHNPTEQKIQLWKKFALAGEYPEKGGPISKFFPAVLCPDQVLEIDCRDIFKHTQGLTAATLRTGFVVILSEVELDVVAVYTASGLFGRVKTIDVEPVTPRLRDPGTQPKEMDHFKVYEVQGSDIDVQVSLTTEWDSGPKEAVIRFLTHFANPTSKAHDAGQFDIKDPNRHLNWYVLEQNLPEPRRTVRYHNQFGQHSIDIKDPAYLLAPTQKLSDEGSMFPESLDHYKCYKVINVNTEPQPQLVILGDQFVSQQQVEVRKPLFLCLPVRKERDGEPPHEIINDKAYLTVYEITPKDEERPIRVKDQFEERSMLVIRSVMLAVPTEIEVVAPHDN